MKEVLFKSILFSLLPLIGIAFIKAALSILKKARQSADIPTSNIDSISMGENIEVKCNIYNQYTENLVAPISNTECIFYLLFFEERRAGGEWRTFTTFFSDDYLYLHNNGRKIARVKVQNADFNLGKLKKRGIYLHKDGALLPMSIKNIITGYRELEEWFPKEKTFSANEIRITEYCLNSMNEVYVVGSAHLPISYHLIKEPHKEITTACFVNKKKPDLNQKLHVELFASDEIGKILKVNKKVLISLISEEKLFRYYKIRSITLIIFAFVMFAVYFLLIL